MDLTATATTMTTRILTITVMHIAHDHGHDHKHAPTADPRAALHAGVHGRSIALEQDILAKNQVLAERNRGWFEGREVLAVNLMSSPGSGKTTLLERTIRELSDDVSIYVVEGDQATTHDAERIRATGCPVDTGQHRHRLPPGGGYARARTEAAQANAAVHWC